MKTLRLIGLWGPVAAFMILIYALAPPGRLPATPVGWDKVLHALAYGVFGALCLRAFHGGFRRLRPLPTLLALLLALSYAMIDELRQRGIAGRHASVFDWLADGAGVMVAVALVSRVGGRRETSRPRAAADR